LKLWTGHSNCQPYKLLDSIYTWKILNCGINFNETTNQQNSKIHNLTTLHCDTVSFYISHCICSVIRETTLHCDTVSFTLHFRLCFYRHDYNWNIVVENDVKHHTQKPPFCYTFPYFVSEIKKSRCIYLIIPYIIFLAI
jgi:hypothetical protein